MFMSCTIYDSLFGGLMSGSVPVTYIIKSFAMEDVESALYPIDSRTFRVDIQVI